MFTIAIDAMGGDHAPGSIIDGVKLALDDPNGAVKIVLVGKKPEIEKHSPDLLDYGDRISIVHAEQVIEMSDSPLEAIKSKRDSSISVIAGLLKKKSVDAIFSAGNTGAHMAASMLSTGKVEGVSRPTIGSYYPIPGSTGFLLDVGANTDCKSHHLLQFGIMGSIFVKNFLGIENPGIGLLNIGSESSKGNSVSIETYKLFKNSGLNFIGNIEGHDLFTGKADLIVCDGFTGNILLKLFETFGPTIVDGLRKNIGGSLTAKLGFSLLNKTIDRFKKVYNYEEYGGVPLLGINGVSMIGHGHSSPAAVKSAIFSAKRIFENDIQGLIRDALSESKEKS